ncbi:MAG: U32 family peptidase [Geobacteraceae bacterium]|nr:U32 family peptidase [Geobacteraceae bacterium]
MKIPELLAPAGNMEKLEMAIHYGADAVYLGGEEFSLRRLADNFTIDGLAHAVRYAHERSKRVYLATNIFPHNADIETIGDYLRKVASIPFDAYIVSDPGVMEMVQEVSPDREIHLSTQANTTNWRSALFWKKQGVSRVNLAREMSLADISETREKSGVDVEVFVHGAMCISYSGRCLLSGVMSGRDANHGECAHPCRWGYAIVEEKRPGQFFPVIEDGRGTFIFNSKDLCLLEYLPELIEAGVDSLKIEGRMKGIHYVASVVRVYREALDSYREDPGKFTVKKEWLSELGKISHRGYTSGFLLGRPGEEAYEAEAGYLRSHEMVGLVSDVLENGDAVIEVRNRVTSADVVEFIGKGMSSHFSAMSTMMALNGAGSDILEVAHPNQLVRMRLPFSVERYDLLRREKKQSD